ncbi:MAG TPA: class I SAM-dependent methyltransferase [Candidatus Binatia bacterium]|nr:class I SAM-dependent methyltransferase [Candidatus Binatia bacterium]
MDALQAPCPAEVLTVPSETTVAERRALYDFFARHWPGTGSVCEIGPFLGSTTRAIALGMLHNPRRAPGARLHTFDRFEGYYTRAALERLLAPLGETTVRRLLPPDDGSPLPGFRTVFDRLHAGTPYAHLVRATTAIIPDLAGQPVGETQRFRLPPDLVLDAVFVDGCKSWYGTRHVLQEVAPRTPPGATFVFQDYAWHTCFWIPSALALLDDCFALRWWVDHTYAFELRRPLDPALVAARIPERPSDLGRDTFDELFIALARAADARGDVRGVVAACLQHAAAFAYLGLGAEARAEILGLARLPFAAAFAFDLVDAMRSPTYRPDGRGGFEPLSIP